MVRKSSLVQLFGCRPYSEENPLCDLKILVLGRCRRRELGDAFADDIDEARAIAAGGERERWPALGPPHVDVDEARPRWSKLAPAQVHIYKVEPGRAERDVDLDRPRREQFQIRVTAASPIHGMLRRGSLSSRSVLHHFLASKLAKG